MNSGSVSGYFLQALPVALLVGILYFIIRTAFLKKRKSKIDCLSEVLRVLFVCYLTGLVSLVVLPANFWLCIYDGIFFGWWDGLRERFHIGGVNLVPSVIKCLAGELALGSWVKTMLVCNILMFVPFGFFLPLTTKIKSFLKMVWIAVLTPVCVEVLQLVFGRSFDVDDLICNFIGILAGVALALKFRLYRRRSLESKSSISKIKKSKIKSEVIA